MSDKRFRVKLVVSYVVYIPVKAQDEDSAVDELEKVLAKSDDYDMVNRSEAKEYQIEEITEDFEKKKERGMRIRKKKKK
jgi:hypothetical protein